MANLSAMKQKLIAIGILTVLAAVAIYFNSKIKLVSLVRTEISLQPSDRPLPLLTSPEQRVNSYTPSYGDFKYRLVQRPVVSQDPTTHWNLYESREYGFSFTFPPDTRIASTESLGYQLPPTQAYHGSRDNFEIKMVNPREAYFLLFLNYPNFHIDNSTTTSQTTVNVNNLKMTKQIMQSTDPKFSGSEIIEYGFDQTGRHYIWYGTFDAQDFESINDFQSIVQSLKFN